jgi:hypothetical protein
LKQKQPRKKSSDSSILKLIKMKRVLKRTPTLIFIGLTFLTTPQLVSANTTPPKAHNVRQIFPRGQGYEARIMNVIGANYKIDVNTDLGRIFARLSLLATEVYFSLDNVITADNAIREVGSIDGKVRAGVQGLLAILVMSETSKAESNPELNALKDWTTKLYRSMKVRAAKGILDEYQKWDVDYCQYKADGYKPPAGCGVGSLDQMQLYSRPSPPQDIIAKAGLKTLFANDADNVAKLISIGVSVATVGAAAIALSTVLGATVWAAAEGASVAALVSLYSAFGGTAAGASAAGAIGFVGWAGVVAAPVAAVVMVIIVGTLEGIRVVEATKAEPMLKMKLAQAMTEHISLPNVFSEVSGRDMFFMAFMEAASKGFRLTPPNVNGEVRYYCQAGYVSKFSVTYTTNVDKTGFKPDWQTITKTTQELPVGKEESFEIPYDARNIRVSGQYLAGTWKSLFNHSLAQPTYICYTSYGTIFDAKYKTDCPEVGNMVAKPNELTVTQGGAYSAWVYLSYKQGGKVVIAQDSKGITAGMRKVYQIPKDATQIYLYIRTATGLAWEPWKKAVEKVWPVPPNECIKVYGTTLDPKWNNECK